MSKNDDGDGSKLATLGALGIILFFLIRNGAGSLIKVKRNPCRLQLTGTGIFHEGSPIESVAKAVKVCQLAGATEAEISATGDTVLGTLENLKQALLTAGMLVRERSPQ